MTKLFGLIAVAAVAGAVTADIKFFFLVAVQLVGFGSLWGSMRANARAMGREIREVKEDLKSEIYPRINRLEISQARDEGREEARKDTPAPGTRVQKKNG